MTLRQQHQAGQNKDLLLKKVNPTAATGVSQVKAGEPARSRESEVPPSA